MLEKALTWQNKTQRDPLEMTLKPRASPEPQAAAERRRQSLLRINEAKVLTNRGALIGTRVAS